MQDAGYKMQEVRSKLPIISYQLSVKNLKWITVHCSLFTVLLLSAYCSLLTKTAFSEELSSPSTTSNPLPPTSKIGIILPLSGRYAQFGEQALKGALLAADIFEARSHGSKEPGDQANIQPMHVEVLVKDTQGDPIASAKAVEELTLNENVVGIIGPLLSITATDTARKEQELRTPIITLSQKEGLTNTGHYIFRNFLLPSEQAKAIAAYAISKLKHKKFAILYPNSPYGIELAHLFKEEVKKSNGEIAAEEHYKEGQTYFGKEIVKLFKIKETEKKEGRRLVKTFETTVAVDALYIPDYFDIIGLIAPHLAYYNVKDVKLLGANGWNSPKLVELAGKYVEGAVFTDGFFTGSKREAVSRFINDFKNLYGTEPGIIAAQAYDATRMMAEAILSGNGKRDEARNYLANLKKFRGVTGDIAFDSNREAIKELFILSVKKGQIVEIN